jgi:hypothetical protein
MRAPNPSPLSMQLPCDDSERTRRPDVCRTASVFLSAIAIVESSCRE